MQKNALLFPRFEVPVQQLLKSQTEKVINQEEKKKIKCTYSWSFSDKYSSEAIGHAESERKKG